MSFSSRIYFGCTVVCLTVCLAGFGQLAQRPDVRLRVDVPLALIPVHVTSNTGGTVLGLNRGSFHLFEDGIEQRISYFANEDAPVSVGFLLDSSGSMKNKLEKSLLAAGQFLKATLPEDEFFLVEFNEHPKLSMPFTRDLAALQRKLWKAHPLGRTSLLDAIHVGLEEAKHAVNARKVLVILSDGGDNHSRWKEADVRKMVREADVQIYSMGIVDAEGGRHTSEEQDGPRLLSDLSEETGGKYFQVAHLEDLAAACARVDHELRNQYLLGYAPENGSRDGRFRHVKVVLNGPDPARVTYRPGYYSRQE